MLRPAYFVHVLTASGIFPAAFATFEIIQLDCDPRWVFGWLLLAVFIDAVDGPLARRWHVKTNAPSIDGRTIDDLLDYLTFAFIPLLLIWRMQWMPDGLGWTVTVAMMASLFGFSHQNAKDENRGMFRGFPSYWNLFAIYAGIFSTQISPWMTAVMLWALTLLTISPVWVIYPNLAPRRYKTAIMVGGLVWACLLLCFLFLNYPSPPPVLVGISLFYPAYYAFVSYRHARDTALGGEVPSNSLKNVDAE